jgi:hypothetical protein
LKSLSQERDSQAGDPEPDRVDQRAEQLGETNPRTVIVALRPVCS